MPVGLCFWVLSLACLVSGAANYVNTVRKYRERRALVQSGWKTQVVSKFRIYNWAERAGRIMGVVRFREVDEQTADCFPDQ